MPRRPPVASLAWLAASARGRVDGLLRHLSGQVGAGVVDALHTEEYSLPPGTRAQVMAQGFVRGLDEELEAVGAPERAAELVRVVGAEVRATLVVLGGCVAMTVGIALVVRAAVRR